MACVQWVRLDKGSSTSMTYSVAQQGSPKQWSGAVAVGCKWWYQVIIPNASKSYVSAVYGECGIAIIPKASVPPIGLIGSKVQKAWASSAPPCWAHCRIWPLNAPALYSTQEEEEEVTEGFRAIHSLPIQHSTVNSQVDVCTCFNKDHSPGGKFFLLKKKLYKERGLLTALETYPGTNYQAHENGERAPICLYCEWHPQYIFTPRGTP